MKKFSLLLTLPLVALCATGCDVLDSIKDILPFPQKDEKDKPDGKVDPTPTVIEYNVTFDANGGTGTMESRKTEGSFVVPDCEFTYEGYSFMEWSLGSTEGTRYHVDDIISDITQDITLYAIWEENTGEQYTVTFNANGGTGTMNPVVISTSSYIVPANSFTFASHKFEAWALNSVDGPKYNHGDRITDISSDFMLYALWKENASGEIDDDYGSYYDSITSELSGESLRSALNAIDKSHKTNVGNYGGIKSKMKYTEKDWTGKENQPGKMFGFYNNAIICEDWDNQATWNREHVWPNSLGGDLVEGDVLMTRPCSVKINSERGNKYYGKGSGLYDPGQYEPNYRGVAARIILYASITNLSMIVADTNSGGSDAKPQMGKLSDLLEWNLQYPPNRDEDAPLTLRIEQNRNKMNYKHPELQHNRNPFVDHPEYACKIWGSTNSATKQICGGN